MSLALHGTGIAKGVAIGKVHRIYSGATDVQQLSISKNQITAECQRFEKAIADTGTELAGIKNSLPKETPSEISAFLDTHLAILNDATLRSDVITAIQQKRCSAEWAVAQHRDNLLAAFNKISDPYLRARSDDIKQVTERLLRYLINPNAISRDISGDTVVVAEDISPADLVLLHRQGITGFICEHGSPLSHTAILARNFGLPSVIGVHNLALLQEQELVVVDGENGAVVAQPSEFLIEHFCNRQQQEKTHRERLNTLIGKPTVSADGIAVHLAANIEMPSDVEQCLANDAEGIGLYRTEFLYLNRNDYPSEDEQYQAYRHVLQAMQDKTVTIRTVDLGADKQAKFSDRPLSSNPALGLRGIRLCLNQPDIFRPQLRALLRASQHGTLRIMLPMVSNSAEITATRELVEELAAELGIKTLPQLGAMIEVPSAALCANELAKIVDFFSIGTNDLIQYTLAMDRVDEDVNYLYQPLNPAVLRLIKMSIDAAEQARKPIEMCGEMASHADYVPLLLGLGLREFSAHPSGILETKDLIQRINISEWQKHSADILSAADTEQAQALLKQNLS